MSPRRHGRGRNGGLAGAAAPEGVRAAGAASVPKGSAPSANGARTVAAPRRPANVKPPVPAAGPALHARPALPARPDLPADGSRAADECKPADGEADVESGERKPACTLAQMRRFIKSRPYVPVHELRRRFEIEGIEDEVSLMPTGRGTLFVGLPVQEAAFLGDLVKSGEVGCELLLDPVGPAVIGVFPMRPVARQ